MRTAPCHAATIPVALVPNCAATRYQRFRLDGSGPAVIDEPSMEPWDSIPDSFVVDDAVRVDLNQLDHAEVGLWKVGQTLPVDLRNRAIYYVGPVDPVAGEAVGPTGPTTATRMDKFVEPLLAQTGLLAMRQGRAGA